MKSERKMLKKNAQRRRRIFLDSVKYGPIFGCVSCHRLCFKNGVDKLNSNFEEELERLFPNLLSKCIGNIRNAPETNGQYYLCATCKSYIYKGKTPPMSHRNNLRVFDHQIILSYN